MSTRSNLAELEALGLIHVAVTSDEAAYIFRHALIQDAAYASLIKQDRRQLNLIVGETLERLYADRVEQIAPRLAAHFDSAGDDRRALKYFTLAGDQAAQQFANAEASTHYTRALDIAKHLPDLGNASSILMHLYLQRGQALHSIASYQGALDNYLDMQQFAQHCGDRSLELHSLIEQSQMYAVFGPLLNPARSIELGQQALTLSEQVDDRTAEARVDWVLMRALAQTGLDPQRAIRYGEQSIALARELKLHEQLAYTLNDIQYAYRSNLMVQPAINALDEARRYWRAIGQQHMLADNLNQAALIQFYLGNFDEAAQLIGESLPISAATDNIIQFTLCYFVRMLIDYERGHFIDALDSYETAIQNFNPILTGVMITKASIMMELGSLELAAQEVQTAQDILHQTNLTAIFGGAVYGLQSRLAIRQNDLAVANQMVERAQRLPGYGVNVNEFLGTEQLYLSEVELALAQQQIDLAQTKCDKYLQLAQDLGARRLLPLFLQLRARIYRTRGEIDRAAQCLEQARSIAGSIGSRTSLMNALIDLIEIEKQHGCDTSALIDQARDLSSFLIDHCPDQLRAAYAAKLKASAW